MRRRFASVVGAITGAPLPDQGQHPAVPGIERAMLRRALEFHAGIRVPAERREEVGELCPYRQEAFFNRRQPTNRTAWLDGAGVALAKTWPKWDGDRLVELDDRGDGTVPATSSVPIEWADTVRAIPLAERHPAMQATRAVLDAITNWARPLDARATKGVPDDTVVELDVPGWIMRGDDLVVSAARARPAPATVEVIEVATGLRRTAPVLLGPAAQARAFSDLTVGVHRLTVQPDDRLLPSVTELVYVADRDG